MPDPLPGALSLECGCFESDMVLPSGQRYALRLWCALGLTVVRQLLGDVVGVDCPLSLLPLESLGEGGGSEGLAPSCKASSAS